MRLQTIIRLWDDAALYAEVSQRTRAHARCWHPDVLRPVYLDFFRNVTHQPGPPLVPLAAVSQVDAAGSPAKPVAKTYPQT